MRLPWSVSCVHACLHECAHMCVCVCVCVCVHACTMRVCVSVRETEVSGWVYECVHVGAWEVVLWCMGVGVKADRTRILVILVLSIWSINHINACDTVYSSMHFYNQYYSM